MGFFSIPLPGVPIQYGGGSSTLDLSFIQGKKKSAATYPPTVSTNPDQVNLPGTGILNTIGVLLDDGLKAYGAVRTADLLEEQIHAGQSPTIVRDQTGVPTAQNISDIVRAGSNTVGSYFGTSGGVIMLVGLGLILYLLLRR